MIVTTTPSVEGRTIREYRGIVFGEVVTGVNFLKDIGAALRNVFGGRSKGYEEELTRARTESLAEMGQRAAALGADAVVGVKMDYEVLGTNNDMSRTASPRASPRRTRAGCGGRAGTWRRRSASLWRPCRDRRPAPRGDP